MRRIILILVLGLFLTACASAPAATPTAIPPSDTALPTATATPVPTSTETPTKEPTARPTLTPTPTITLTSTPTRPAISPENAVNIKELYRIGNGNPVDLAWWPNPETLAVVTMAGIFLYDAETYEELRSIEPPEQEMISLAALSPDGYTIASMNVTYGDVQVWDADTGQTKYIIEIDHSYKGFSGFLETIVFSPDGKLLASGGCAQDTRMYDVESGELVRTFPGQTQGLAFSEDGEQLISIGCQGNPFPSSPMTTWEVDSGRLISSINRPNRTDPGYISISPDGQLFAVNSENEVALIDAKSGVTRNRLIEEEGVIYRNGI